MPNVSTSRSQSTTVTLTAPITSAKLERGELPCWVTRRTPRGRWLSRSYFDVPDEEFAAGNATGARLARDLIRIMRAASEEQRWRLGLDVGQTILEAARVPKDSGRSGAASGFLRTMFGVLRGGVIYTDADAYADAMVDDAEEGHAWLEKAEARAKSEFVQRMKEARAAKRNVTTGSHQ